MLEIEPNNNVFLPMQEVRDNKNIAVRAIFTMGFIATLIYQSSFHGEHD